MRLASSSGKESGTLGPRLDDGPADADPAGTCARVLENQHDCGEGETSHIMFMSMNMNI